MMSDIKEIVKLYDLRNVEREYSQGERKESAAEHTWSSLILADILFELFEYDMDKAKVFRILLYHDAPEITEDHIPLIKKGYDNAPDIRRKQFKGIHKITMDFPSPHKRDVVGSYKAYHDLDTDEGKFAMATQHLDAELQRLETEEDFKDWDENAILDRKRRFMQDFPEILDALKEIIAYQKDKGWI